MSYRYYTKQDSANTHRKHWGNYTDIGKIFPEEAYESYLNVKSRAGCRKDCTKAERDWPPEALFNMPDWKHYIYSTMHQLQTKPDLHIWMQASGRVTTKLVGIDIAGFFIK